MEIDSTTIFPALGVVISVCASAVSHGIMKEKVLRLEQDVTEHHVEDRKTHENMRKEYVPMNHFSAVMEPLKESLRDVQNDLKTILSRLPKT